MGGDRRVQGESEPTTRALTVVPGGLARAREPDPGGARCYDFVAEGSVLSALFRDGQGTLDAIGDTLRAAHFYSGGHQRIWQAALDLRASGEVDPTMPSVMGRLRDQDRLAEVGGAPYLTELLTYGGIYTVAALRSAAKRVRDLFVRRRLRDLGRAVTVLADTSSRETSDLLEEALENLEGASVELGGAESADHVSIAAPAALAHLRALAAGDIRPRSSGFPELDAITGGLHEELITLGGRPGMGKTALATRIAMHVARSGEGVYIASLETLRGPLLVRMACADAGLPVRKALDGMLVGDQWERLARAMEELRALPIWVNEQRKLSAAQLFGCARRAQLELRSEKKKLGLVVVDYLQLLGAARAGHTDRQEIVAETSRTLAGMAAELRVPVLALSQLKRPHKDHPRPQVTDLRESGQIEQDSRTILLLWREDEHARATKRRNYEPTGLAEIIVAKQNNGQTGTAWAAFDGPTTLFAPRPLASQAPHSAYCRCGRCPPVECPRDVLPVNAPQPGDEAFHGTFAEGLGLDATRSAT